MLYELAEKACSTMNTCLDSTGAPSYVNYYVFKQFEQGQRKLLDGKCEAAQTHKENIATLMTIPLIQRTIRYAHMVSDEISISAYNEQHAAQGAVYALSVLPLIYSCSPDDARIIFDNLKAKENPTVDFAAVKNAFERNYDCLGVLCSEIGGAWNGDEYFSGASPCDDATNFSIDVDTSGKADVDTSGEADSKQSSGLIVLLIYVGLLIVGLLLVLIVRTGIFNMSEVELDTGKGEERGTGERPCPELAEPEEEEEAIFHAEVA
jgi:hypothetical protein